MQVLAGPCVCGSRAQKPAPWRLRWPARWMPLPRSTPSKQGAAALYEGRLHCTKAGIRCENFWLELPVGTSHVEESAQSAQSLDTEERCTWTVPCVPSAPGKWAKLHLWYQLQS